MSEIEQKQIEEMARVMAKCEKTCDECFAEYEKLFTQPIQDRSKHCQAIEYCTTLYNAGYRNTKDKVVLSREEHTAFINEFTELKRKYEDICDRYKLCKDEIEIEQKQKDKVHSRREWYQIGYKEARKETAREFAKELLTWLEKDDIDGRNCVIEVAKQYGVEVE